MRAIQVTARKAFLVELAQLAAGQQFAAQALFLRRRTIAPVDPVRLRQLLHTRDPFGDVIGYFRKASKGVESGRHVVSSTLE
jgi:hypothetical protein